MQYDERFRLFFIVILLSIFCIQKKVRTKEVSFLSYFVVPISSARWERSSPHGIFSEVMRDILGQNNKYTVNGSVKLNDFKACLVNIRF